MTQEQVNRGYAYMKSLSCKRKLVFDEDNNKDLVKKEKEELMAGLKWNSPVLTIYFIGYKKIKDELYKCEDCFRREMKREDVDSFITYGEKPLLREGHNKRDLSDFCVECKKKLYIIRPKDTVHLDFE